MTLSMNMVAAAVHAVKYGSWYTNADGTQRLRDQVVVAVAVGGGAAEARSAIARTPARRGSAVSRTPGVRARGARLAASRFPDSAASWLLASLDPAGGPDNRPDVLPQGAGGVADAHHPGVRSTRRHGYLVGATTGIVADPDTRAWAVGQRPQRSGESPSARLSRDR